MLIKGKIKLFKPKFLNKNKLKSLFKIKKFLKYKFYKPFFYNNFLANRIKNFYYYLTIRVTSNNIFCNLVDLKKKKRLVVASSGKYNIKVSKKKLRHTFKPVLTSFFQEIRTKIINKNLFLVVTSPVRIRKQILKFIYPKILEKTNLVLKVKEKKCFNGCRVKKKKRKKQKGLKLWK